MEFTKMMLNRLRVDVMKSILYRRSPCRPSDSLNEYLIASVAYQAVRLTVAFVKGCWTTLKLATVGACYELSLQNFYALRTPSGKRPKQQGIFP